MSVFPRVFGHSRRRIPRVFPADRPLSADIQHGFHQRKDDLCLRCDLRLGIGQGFQPVSAFNYGAGKYSRLRKAFWVTVLMSECVILVTASVCFLLSGSLVGVFRDDPTVIRIGTRALRLQMATVIFLPFTMCTEMLYQSTGHRFGASFLSSARSGLFFIPALLLLSGWRALSGIQEAQPAAYLMAVPLSAAFIVHFMRTLPREDAKEST